MMMPKAGSKRATSSIVLSFVSIVTACASTLHDPSIAITQQSTPYANGRIVSNARSMKLFKSILSECRIGLVRYARDRGTGEDPSELGKPIDETTADDWKPDLQRDEVIVASNVSFRVVATVSYRCSLPLMIGGSANDEAMNGNAIGGNGTYKEIEILAGPNRGTHALWKPD